eukprot:4092091-Pleurochrysis_carterae.AAC.2
MHGWVATMLPSVPHTALVIAMRKSSFIVSFHPLASRYVSMRAPTVLCTTSLLSSTMSELCQLKQSSKLHPGSEIARTGDLISRHRPVGVLMDPVRFVGSRLFRDIGINKLNTETGRTNY